MERILLIEDDHKTNQTITNTLQNNLRQVEIANNGKVGFYKLQAFPADLIICREELARIDGEQLLLRIRANPLWHFIPVIFLTKPPTANKMRYWQTIGVDDYITLPVIPEDLLAIVQGKLKRVRYLKNIKPTVNSHQSHLIHSHGLIIDLKRRHVQLNEKPVFLTARELRLLLRLAESPNRSVPFAELLKITHGLVSRKRKAGYYLRPLVHSLRKKLRHKPQDPDYIFTIRGHGYQLSISQ